MAKTYSIHMPKTLTVTVRDEPYVFNIEDLPAEVIREAALFGLRNTIRNAAEAAEHPDAVRDLMRKRLTQLHTAWKKSP